MNKRALVMVDLLLALRKQDLHKVLLDTDARCEADDQHFVSYALFSELDVLGISSVQNGEGTESINYGEIHYVIRLAQRVGYPKHPAPLTSISMEQYKTQSLARRLCSGRRD
jgi:hypothetical protein